MTTQILEQNILDEIFPAAIADEFFEAIYGGVEDGAYDIRLACERLDNKKATMCFKLERRPQKCLKCNLTWGLPEVFKRHPVINLQKRAQDIAKAAGLTGKINWKLGETAEINDDLHVIPFEVWQE